MVSSPLTELLACPAPAKLNLFLHIIGRRADGYHLLQSVFQLINRSDSLDFFLKHDGSIQRLNEVPGVAEQDDLVIRAARLLQNHAKVTAGVAIRLHKNLPMGGGLGGGSSDAATTLMALNQLWNCGLSQTELMELGLQLGADVPFFIFGKNAFVEGIGEVMQEVSCPEQWFVVLEPGVHIATPTIFSAKELTRDTKPVRIADFSKANKIVWKNDLQAVACALYQPVQDAINWLNQFKTDQQIEADEARMTGSGSCVFIAVSTESDAKKIQENVPDTWNSWTAKALQQHPFLSHKNGNAE